MHYIINLSHKVIIFITIISVCKHFVIYSKTEKPNFCSSCLHRNRLFTLLCPTHNFRPPGTDYYRPRHLVLGHMNSVHSIPSYASDIHSIQSSHLRLGLPKSLFLSDFLTKPCTHLSFPHSALCLTHLILLNFKAR